MKYLESLSEWPAEFWIAVVLGSFAVWLFAYGEFDRPTSKRDAETPEADFTPHELTTRGDYLFSFFLYVLGLQAVYLSICLLGPAPFVGIGVAADGKMSFESAASFPLWVALTMVGILPRVSFFGFIEESWRRLMHERASIPHAALLLAQEMRRGEIDIARYHDHLVGATVGNGGGVVPADLEADPRSPSHRWARLSALLWTLESAATDPELEEYLDARFIRRHGKAFDAIRFGYRDLADRIRSARTPTEHDAAPAPAGPVPGEFAGDIESLLRRVGLFLACALIARNRSHKLLEKALSVLGWRRSGPCQRTSEIDVVIQSFFFALVAFVLLLFAAPALTPLLPGTIADSWPEWRRMDAFLWSFSVLLTHGSAVLSALALRRYLRRQHGYFRGAISTPRTPGASLYGLVGLVGYVVAFAAVSYWDGVVLGAEAIWSGAGHRYAAALVPTASAVFTCVLLDHAHVHGIAGRLSLLVGLQWITTALLGLIAASSYYQAHDPYPIGAIVFTTLSAGCFALVLGSSTAHLAPRAAGSAVVEAEDALA